MARITVEDCLKNVKNRFELVLLAAKRARQLMHGATPKVATDNDKVTIVALREIAAGFTNFDLKPEDVLNMPPADPVPATPANVSAPQSDLPT